MADLNRLYQQIILEHNRNPHHFGRPENSNRSAEGQNPVCGDSISVHVCLQNTIISEIGFEGAGCAIAMASASLMTDHVKGKSSLEASAIFEMLLKMLNEPGDPAEQLGQLRALAGVRQFPVRMKCAILPWRTLLAALSDSSSHSVSTE